MGKNSKTRRPSGLAKTLGPLAERVNAALARWLNDRQIPPTLANALRYVTLLGGKRLRPALVLLSAQAVGRGPDWRTDPMPAAVAVEMIHCYSLVHDDLPAMDNDSLRRGRPTAHVAFGEAMSILAGDALLTRAFEVIARGVPNKALAAQLVAELAAAAGPAGMIAGQVADMALCPVPRGAEGCRYIHQRKTAALFRAAARMGGLCAGASPAQLKALTGFAERLGLAFQAADDLLDATAGAKALGKTPGKDARARKRTYVACFGTARTGKLVDRLTRQALAALKPLGRRGSRLAEVAELLCRRDR